MSEATMAAILGAFAAAGLSSLLTGIVTVTRIKVYMDWFKAELARVGSVADRAHTRIDEFHSIGRDNAKRQRG